MELEYGPLIGPRFEPNLDPSIRTKFETNKIDFELGIKSGTGTVI